MKESIISVILTNSMAFVMLLMIFINSKIHRDILKDQTLYRSIIIFTGISLLLEVLAFCIDGKTFVGANTLNRLVNALLFINNPLTALMWVLYAEYKIFVNTKKILKKLWILLIPIFINTILCLSSLFWDVMFKIDSNNVYHRMPLIWFTFAVVLFYMLHAFVTILKHKDCIPKSSLFPMLFFPAPAIIAGILQLCFYGLSLMWVGCAFSILLINFTVQNEMAKTDYLTNLPNRLQLDSYLRSRLNNEGCKNVVGLMIDIDSFKKINDNFGHTIGDDALVCAAKLFNKSVNYGDFVARYGGDEFVIILNDKKSDAQETVNALRKNSDCFNASSQKPYKLEFSIGCLVYSVSQKANVDEFYKNLDKNMYEDKHARKAFREAL